MGLHMGVTKWPKLIIFTFSHKKPPKRLILLSESAETSCVISIEVNLSIGILIMGLSTAKVFLAQRNVLFVRSSVVLWLRETGRRRQGVRVREAFKPASL